MIWRTYSILMPNAAGTPLDIAALTAPGTRAAPVGTGGAAASAANGAYFEMRGRPIRFETVVGQTGFVPRCRLGYILSCNLFMLAAETEIPGVVLSESFVGTLLVGATGSPAPVSLVDPGYGPTIRVLNHANLVGNTYVLNIGIVEAKDDDRSHNGV